MSDPYDELPYLKFPYPATHPDRLATVATLHGLEAPRPSGCRYLEVGCGAGANLLPLAYADPERRCVGLDRAGSAVADGQRTIEALDLGNADIVQRDLTTVGPGELGEFDFVVAHGVYSWVPEPVRDSLMALIASHLAPDGVAFVSYNAQPAGTLRRLLGQMGAWHARRREGALERAEDARELYEVLLNHRASGEDAYGALLLHELPRLVTRSAASLYHDELSEEGTAIWLHAFAEHARAHGLDFVGDAQFGELQDARVPAQVRPDLDRLAGDDRVAREQYVDVMLGRRFRQTILCHAGRDPVPGPQASIMPRLRFAAPPGPIQASAEGLEARAMDVLADVWPRSLAFEEILARLEAAAAELAEALLAAFRAGRVGPRLDPPTFTVEPGERPRASAYARLQAQEGPSVTSLRHEPVRVEEPAARRLLTLLDGTRDRAAILRDFARAPDGTHLDEEALQGNLEQLAALALLHD